MKYAFGIEFDEDTAFDMYNMTLKEASVLIANMIQKQNPGDRAHYSEMMIENLTLQQAKMILFELWKNNCKIRKDILEIIYKLEMQNGSQGI